MAKKAKAILLNDTERWYHWGCHLTSRALKKLIGSHFDLVFSVPIDHLHGIPQAPSGVHEFNDPAFLRTFIQDNVELIELLNQVDAVFINGEGSLHGCADLAMNLLYLALIAKLALNKNVHIVNHSSYPNDSIHAMGNHLDQLYADVYQVVDYVAIREPQSLQLIRKLGVDCVQQSFDCSVLELKTSFASRRKLISLGGSVCFDTGGLMQLLKTLGRYNRKGYEIRFLYGAPAQTAADDLTFLQLLREQSQCPVTPTYCTSADEFTNHIQQSAVMVSGRFHYAIIAHALGTPPVLLDSNTAKNNGLSEQLDVTPPLAWTDPHLEDKAATLIERALAAEDFANAAAMRLTALQETALRNLPPECRNNETRAIAVPAAQVYAKKAV